MKDYIKDVPDDFGCDELDVIVPRQMVIDYTTKELKLGYLLNGSVTELKDN